MKDKSHEEDVSGFLNGMGQFWQEMWEKSRVMYPTTPESDIDFNARCKELNELWTKNYSKIVMDIIKSPAFADMNGRILDSNLEIRRLNDQFMSQYLGAMGLPTKESMNDIYLKLHDMDRKLSEISRALSQKTTGKK